MNIRTHALIVFFVSSANLFCTHQATARSSLTQKAPEAKTAPAPSPASAQKDEVLNNSWYTMQAGSTPWGYLHEVIEKKGNRYYYRYAMTKVEGKNAYQETIGAIAEEDLTPVAFNLVKAGVGATEVIDGTYTKSASGGTMRMKISGARSAEMPLFLSKQTILDVFVPVWMKHNWSKLKPNARGQIRTLGEDPHQGRFLVRTMNYKVIGNDSENQCLEIHFETQDFSANWCMTAQGALVRLTTGNHRVQRVESEAKAKKFLSGRLPKDTDQQ
ncbi:MAG: hypothetical protein AB1540_12475 [Bdellovibrionota bacterium]